jgi:hypothetical protein
MSKGFGTVIAFTLIQHVSVALGMKSATTTFCINHKESSDEQLQSCFGSN